MQQRSKIFPIKRTQPFREAPNLRSRIPLNLSVCSAFTLILMLVGCTDGETPIPSILHTLEINSVTITTDTLETGNTATVTASNQLFRRSCIPHLHMESDRRENCR